MGSLTPSKVSIYRKFETKIMQHNQSKVAKYRPKSHYLKTQNPTLHTVDGNQKSGKLTSWGWCLKSHYLRGFVHARWFFRDFWTTNIPPKLSRFSGTTVAAAMALAAAAKASANFEACLDFAANYRGWLDVSMVVSCFPEKRGLGDIYIYRYNPPIGRFFTTYIIYHL